MSKWYQWVAFICLIVKYEWYWFFSSMWIACNFKCDCSFFAVTCSATLMSKLNIAWLSCSFSISFNRLDNVRLIWIICERIAFIWKIKHILIFYNLICISICGCVMWVTRVCCVLTKIELIIVKRIYFRNNLVIWCIVLERNEIKELIISIDITLNIL